MSKQKRDKSDVSDTFTERLRAELARTGMSQSELARRAGLTKSVISRLATMGQPPTLVQAWQVAEALGLSLSEMLPESIVGDGPPAYQRLHDAIKAGSSPDAAAALSDLMGVPFTVAVNNPAVGPEQARLLKAIEGGDRLEIRARLQDVLSPTTYAEITTSTTLDIDRSVLVEAIRAATAGLSQLADLAETAGHQSDPASNNDV